MIDLLFFYQNRNSKIQPSTKRKQQQATQRVFDTAGPATCATGWNWQLIH
jgi:hypothetical protein